MRKIPVRRAPLASGDASPLPGQTVITRILTQALALRGLSSGAQLT